MARYTDIDKLIAEYDRVHVGPAGGARKLMVEALIADVAPRAEVEKIFGEIQDLMREWFDFFRQDDCIRESCAIMAVLSQISELKKKYTESKDDT